MTSQPKLSLSYCTGAMQLAALHRSRSQRWACLVLRTESLHPGPAALLHARYYANSSACLEVNAVKVDKKVAAQEYATRRTAYRKQVSLLRKDYASEVKIQREAAEKEQAEKRRQATRLRLERQRLKNVRSAQNILRQREESIQRAREFEQELMETQKNRDARKALFAKARQLLVDELEAEAPLWLTTPEEVERAFTPEAEQLLWTHPRSVIGAPLPTDDAEFWNFETHTWHMDKTYATSKELLLKQVEEAAYYEANIDKDFWTPEKLLARQQLADKAKLRAMVRDAGKRALLQKQQELMQDRFSDSGIPEPVPVPSIRVLANTRAMEKEGAKVLLNDPTKFFEFEKTVVEHDGDGETDSTYGGPTLGVPLGLKDPLRSKSGTVFPTFVGRMPKPDTRTEREKKRELREERMLAAQGEDGKDAMQIAIEQAAGEIVGEPADFSQLHYESDDEWEKGLDPETDEKILQTPRPYRYKDEDVDWVVTKLEEKVKHLEDQLKFDLESTRQEMLAKKESDEREQEVLGGNVTANADDTDEPDGVSVAKDLENADLRELGVDVDAIEAVVASLTDEQIVALCALDDHDFESMTSNEIVVKLKDSAGLTDAQVAEFLQLEGLLSQNEKLKDAFQADKDE